MSESIEVVMDWDFDSMSKKQLRDLMPWTPEEYKIERSGDQAIHGSREKGTEAAHTVSFRLVSFFLFIHYSRTGRVPGPTAKKIASKKLDIKRNLRITTPWWNEMDDYNDVRIMCALYFDDTITNFWVANRLAWVYKFLSWPRRRSRLLKEVCRMVARLRVFVPGMEREALLPDFYEYEWVALRKQYKEAEEDAKEEERRARMDEEELDAEEMAMLAWIASQEVEEEAAEDGRARMDGQSCDGSHSNERKMEDSC